MGQGLPGPVEGILDALQLHPDHPDNLRRLRSERREPSSCDILALFETQVVTLESGASSSLNLTFCLAAELEVVDRVGDCLVRRGLGRSLGLGPSTSAVSGSSDTLRARRTLSKNIK
jgi:hypothetical protein